ncbi:MAG TPA: MarR family transcriptional regulator [Ramlibacter sp.]|uniref:MarR family winged helix-turn-helix transcriptional regulator n=1 Tax=Ramlibacter sp. TaxID=1917967 RepID=UPI002C13D3D6|nr:MarR family transcriptional regulator [Ramlibacter sp.]HVZ42462.1 MarR family transcriptional regulator [Ramlibacter sp.]
MTQSRSAARLARPASLDDLLLYRLGRIFSVAGSMVIRLCEGRFGITRREWRLIALLAREDGLLSSQLAERAGLDRARTSRAITSLVGKKLALRVVGQDDRRQARLALTPAGRKVFSELFPLVRDINRGLIAELAPREVAGLDAALASMQTRADFLAAHADLPKANRRRGGRTRAQTG